MSENESLCYSCQLFDRSIGCLGLSDTFFPDYPCPFYKPMPPTPKGDVYTGSDCRKCFAGTAMGSCRALVKKPDEGTCIFFKTIADYERECRRCDARIREYVKANPGILDKYHALKQPKRNHKAVKENV